MTRLEDSNAMMQVLELVNEHGVEGMADAFATLLNIAMRCEREQVLGAAAYQRSEQRRGHANGFKSKTIATRAGDVTVQVPQTRGVSFYPSALEKGVRSERALKLALAEMYVQGVSTRKVTTVLEKMCGLEVSSTQVSRVAAELDEQLEAWRSRPLGEVSYLILDARYEKVRHEGTVVSAAVLSAIGILPNGQRSILGVSCTLSEAEVHWRSFLESLARRGMHGVRYIVSDDHPGLRAAREALFAGIPWQRCQFHLAQNAMAFVPRLDDRKQVGEELRTVFNAADRDEADRRLKQMVEHHREARPKLAEWLEHNVPEALTVFILPEPHRRRMRTTNGLERLHKEIKRRTRVATLFPNEASALRLVSAILCEIDQDWQGGRAYLKMQT